jgi:lysophospholipase L1-like esterase
MEQVLVRIAGTAARHQVSIFFVFIPSAFDVAEGFVHPDPAEFPAYRPSALTDALTGAAERHGLAFLDLFPAFQQARPRELYFHDDEHWNAAGQSLAADHVALVVRARGLFE